MSRNAIVSAESQVNSYWMQHPDGSFRQYSRSHEWEDKQKKTSRTASYVIWPRVIAALLAVTLRIVKFLGFHSSRVARSSNHDTTAVIARPLVTDLTVRISDPHLPSSYNELDPHVWCRIEKDLYLYEYQRQAWLYIVLANEEELAAEDLLIVDIRIGERPPDTISDHIWESRPCGIWILRSKFVHKMNQAVTGVNVLFGEDAVDPRPQWTLIQAPLQLDVESKTPIARLSILIGKVKPIPEARTTLRVRRDGKFNVVQISDTHMVTGVGVCTDAIDADGSYLPDTQADPLTVSFIGKVLDIEKPDLVIFTGDQVHHDVSDTQSALFKVVAPAIERSVPFAAVFGNHDSEGSHALSRITQMSMLQSLPCSLCEPGPKQIDGIGNFVLEILAPSPSQLPLATLYLLDSHGQIPSKIRNPDYEPINQSQIDWFVNTSKARRNLRKEEYTDDQLHLSLVFQHIPIPEFGDRKTDIVSGQRREPTEGPSFNSQFYDALVQEGVSAIACGHDHVNDFCALLTHGAQDNSKKSLRSGPWLCYGGGSGFGGYCSYGKKRYHRRMRVWELDTNSGSLKTWMRVEYAASRINETVLVDNGTVVHPTGAKDDDR